MNPPLSRRSLLALSGLSLLSACSGENGESSASTIDWWHISTTDPMLSLWATLAKEFETAHAGAKVTITPLENEAFKAKLTTVTQAGNPPHLFHSWGGGVLKQQVQAGLVKELPLSLGDGLTPAALDPYKVDGKLYGLPFDIGMVGFWYNKELFAKAGADIPATWADLLAAVQKLKTAGVTPIALAGADKWPAHFYWSYLAMRIGGLDALKQAEKDGNFDTPDFVAAGQRFKELIDLQPFQKGFLGAKYDAPDGQAAAIGNGQAAMELMGQWGPSVQNSSSASKNGLGDKLGFFPFPAVDGGKGKAADAFGGGNGFALGHNAPAITSDFVKFLVDPANQRREAATGAVLPVAKGADDAIKDANMATVAKSLSSATGFQLYLDQAYAPAVGQQVNDSVAELVAGTVTPQQVAQAITKTAKNQ